MPMSGIMWWLHCPLRAGTPAAHLMRVTGQLLAGEFPEVQDVVLIRTALQQNWDMHTPYDLAGNIRASDLDVRASA